MKKNILWILAALMISFVAVSCSGDDDNEPDKTDEPMRYEPKDGKVTMGDGEFTRDIPYVPVDIKDLPEWLQKIIYAGKDFYIVCEGTWFGKRAFFYWDTFMSSSGGFFLEDGTYVGEYDLNPNFRDNGGWEGWVCIVYGIPPCD